MSSAILRRRAFPSKDVFELTRADVLSYPSSASPRHRLHSRPPELLEDSYRLRASCHASAPCPVRADIATTFVFGYLAANADRSRSNRGASRRSVLLMTMMSASSSCL